jgi:hypothetical protein
MNLMLAVLSAFYVLNVWFSIVRDPEEAMALLVHLTMDPAKQRNYHVGNGL